MPVLPNPDPQVWRMLLGSRADEFLGAGKGEKEDSSPTPDVQQETLTEGKPSAGSDGRGRKVGDR